MTQEIIEGNKLIAEFMGAKPYYLDVNVLSFPMMENPAQSVNNTTTHHVSALEYHSDWNWLMPAVEKIQKERPVFIASQNDMEHRCSIGIGWIQIIDESMIRAVWLAVIEFIEWYNQNK